MVARSGRNMVDVGLMRSPDLATPTGRGPVDGHLGPRNGTATIRHRRSVGNDAGRRPAPVPVTTSAVVSHGSFFPSGPNCFRYATMLSTSLCLLRPAKDIFVPGTLAFGSRM